MGYAQMVYPGKSYTASDTVIAQSIGTNTNSTQPATYTTVKEITRNTDVSPAGILRFKYTCQINAGTGTFALHRNGVLVGTENAIADTGAHAEIDNVAFTDLKVGDKFQVKFKCTSGVPTASVSYFYICALESPYVNTVGA